MMSINRKFSIANIAIYIALFVADVIFIGFIKGDVGDIAGDIIAGNPEIAGVLTGVAMILAIMMLTVFGVLMIINIVLKILQICFDKWGFSIPSVILASFMVLWTGIVTITYLSGNSGALVVVCILFMIAEIAALILECINIAKKDSI
jgi:hypothetical protein